MKKMSDRLSSLRAVRNVLPSGLKSLGKCWWDILLRGYARIIGEWWWDYLTSTGLWSFHAIGTEMVR